MPITIYLVDDHPLVQHVISEWINDLSGMTVCGTTTTGQAALTEIPLVRPDLVIVDLSLPDMSGIDVVSQLQFQSPTIPTLILSSYEDVSRIRRALAAGAKGYVLKNSPHELEPAIRGILAGEIYFSPALRSKLGLNLSTLPSASKNH